MADSSQEPHLSIGDTRGKARRPRADISTSARRLFIERGYTATTVGEIAADAQVAVGTVYAAVGPKPVVFRLLLETAISGTDEAVVAGERDYGQRISAQPRARDKLWTYAAAIRAISERMGPLHRVLRDAAPQALELARIWQDIADRRA